MRCVLVFVALTGVAGAQELPEPSSLTSPPVVTRIPEEAMKVKSGPRHGLRIGLTLATEVMRDDEPAYAMGAGVELGWEILGRSVALELGLEAQAHYDHGHTFWEAHPIVLLKRPFARGVWEFYVGYGFSPRQLHRGWLAREADVHVATLGFEDRTSRWYSRFFLRGYLEGDERLFIAGVSVGRFDVD